MEAMRQSWTDERLDDFAGQVWRRFDDVDRRFDEVDRRFDHVEARLDQIDSRFERLEKRIDDVARVMLLFAGGSMVTFVVGFAGIIAAQ